MRQQKQLLQALVRRIEVAPDEFRIIMSLHELSRLLAWDGVGIYRAADVVAKRDADRTHVLRVPAAITRDPKYVALPTAVANTVARSRPNPGLVSLLAQAQAAKDLLYANPQQSTQELAKKLRRGPSFFSRLVRLTYLAPDIAAAILDGRHPEGLTRKKLAYATLPIDWSHQRELLGFPPAG